MLPMTDQDVHLYHSFLADAVMVFVALLLLQLDQEKSSFVLDPSLAMGSVIA